jgi:hypothetical protein
MNNAAAPLVQAHLAVLVQTRLTPLVQAHLAVLVQTRLRRWFKVLQTKTTTHPSSLILRIQRPLRLVDRYRRGATGGGDA